MKKIFLMEAIGILLFLNAASQENNQLGQIHGNFQIIAQYYNTDTVIGAPVVDEKLRENAFLNLNYTRGKFKAGLRYESYLNPLLGFAPNYKGNGIAYRYASYSLDNLSITAGSFYEQFGNGLILRTYIVEGLGYDNFLDGVRVKYQPVKGIYLTGLIGKQRVFWEYGDGIVRGFDSDIQLNEALPKMENSKLRLALGGSFVSKYQKDDDPVLTLPENVGAYAGRINLNYGNFNFATEYAYKINDPSSDNKYIYKPGQALYVATGYSAKGLGINIMAKSIDNMSFRSDRNASLNNLMINYLPATTRQHTYNLAATLYPYATQPNGEVGIQGDIIYKIKKNSLIGGKYGTTIAVNYARVHSPDTIAYPSITDPDSTRMGYRSNLLSIGNHVYFSDFNVEITRKISKKLKIKAMYMNLIYDMEVVQGLGGKPTVYADIGVLDILYKIAKKHAIRTEWQYLRTNQDHGDWATVIAEYTISPHWFFALMDQYNIGNPKPEDRIHYPLGSFGYNKGGNRFMISYGRQRAGIFCVGGVCRNVPASNGLTLTITSTF